MTPEELKKLIEDLENLIKDAQRYLDISFCDPIHKDSMFEYWRGLKAGYEYALNQLLIYKK